MQIQSIRGNLFFSTAQTVRKMADSVQEKAKRISAHTAITNGYFLVTNVCKRIFHFLILMIVAPILFHYVILMYFLHNISYFSSYLSAKLHFSAL